MPREDKANTRTFKTDPILELGMNHAEAEQQILQIALAAPAEYFRLRQDLLSILLKDQVKAMYNLIWNALTEGVVGGIPILYVKEDPAKKAGLSGKFSIVPDYPEHEVNAIAMSVAQGYKDLIEKEVVDKLLPPNFGETARQKTAAVTAMNLVKGAAADA